MTKSVSCQAVGWKIGELQFDLRGEQNLVSSQTYSDQFWSSSIFLSNGHHGKFYCR